MDRIYTGLQSIDREPSMAGATSEDISGLLTAWAGGDAGALEKLTPLVYGELLRIARRCMRQQSPQTLDTTALVHEAYLRFVGMGGLHWQDRAHFLAVAAQMMRRILVDAARSRAAVKRQGGAQRITFDESIPVSPQRDGSLLALDDALAALEKFDPRKARVVELRFFGGLTAEETAEVLKISPESVRRDWRLAKPWLAREVARRGKHVS